MPAPPPPPASMLACVMATPSVFTPRPTYRLAVPTVPIVMAPLVSQPLTHVPPLLFSSTDPAWTLVTNVPQHAATHWEFPPSTIRTVPAEKKAEKIAPVDSIDRVP